MTAWAAVVAVACSDPSSSLAEGFVYTAVTTGEAHSCGVHPDGHVFCWGRGAGGVLGDGDFQNRTQPHLTQLPPIAVDVSAGVSHTCALSRDGAIFCWGNNAFGQFGQGHQTSNPSPTQLVDGRRYRQLSVGAYHTCALTEEDEALCWGYNGQGQLGTGTLDDAWSPTPIAGERHYRDISAGTLHTCAVSTAGEVYCWGLNVTGQIGDGSTASRLEPVLVAEPQFRSVSAGHQHTCALTQAGATYCWGSSTHGELGVGHIAPPLLWGVTRPHFVEGLAPLATISAGHHVTCGTGAGVLYCWGRGEFGQLALGRLQDHARPQRVFEQDVHFVAVSARGSRHACGLSLHGGAYCWGEGFYGQLGAGGERVATIPIRVQGGAR